MFQIIFRKKKLIIALYFLFIFSLFTKANSQEKQLIITDDYQNEKVEMADKMRSEGKIYVVIATIALVMVGFTIYLISIDRKLTKIENQIKQQLHNTIN